jgi:hypothetical protein
MQVRPDQIFVPLGVLDFIDADGVDLTERAMLQTPGDDVFYRIENLIPGRAERIGRFFPRKPACPTSQKQHVGICPLMFAVAPGNFLDDYSFATAAIDAPHGVQEEDEEPPERDKHKAPFGELVVTGRRLLAARADRERTLARAYGNLDTLLVGTEAGTLVNESPKMMATV